MELGKHNKHWSNRRISSSLRSMSPQSDRSLMLVTPSSISVSVSHNGRSFCRLCSVRKVGHIVLNPRVGILPEQLVFLAAIHVGPPPALQEKLVCSTSQDLTLPIGRHLFRRRPRRFFSNGWRRRSRLEQSGRTAGAEPRASIRGCWNLPSWQVQLRVLTPVREPCQT